MSQGEASVTCRASQICVGFRVTTERRYALLVEDELLVAMVAMDALDELGFQVLEAASAARALELAQAHQGTIAFAIVDLGLPDRDGVDLIRRIRSWSSVGIRRKARFPSPRASTALRWQLWI